MSYIPPSHHPPKCSEVLCYFFWWKGNRVTKDDVPLKTSVYRIPWPPVTPGDTNLSSVLLDHSCGFFFFFKELLYYFYFFRCTRLSSLLATCLVTNHSYLVAVLLGKDHVIFLAPLSVYDTCFLCLHPTNFPSSSFLLHISPWMRLWYLLGNFSHP